LYKCVASVLFVNIYKSLSLEKKHAKIKCTPEKVKKKKKKNASKK